MKFAILGWSYKNTPIEIRERLALSPSENLILAKGLFHEMGLKEIVIVSTCNRMELYCIAPHPRIVVQKIKERLIQHFNLPELAELAYEAYDIDAVRHLFRMSGSLDSMILGETQILGQVKAAYHQFDENQYTGSLFKGLFPRTFLTAKRIRRETKLSHFAVSISFAAVELAKRIFDDLSKQTIMIIGAGQMAELAAKHFIKNGVSKLIVTNRTFSNAVSLAEEYKGSAIQFEQLTDYLANADIIISSTGAQNHIITPAMVKHSVKKRKGKAMFIIDIAVPRDVDPAVNDLSNIYSYDIDDLQNVVDNNRKVREKEAEIASQIVEEEIEKLQVWFQNRSIVPTIKELRESFHDIGNQELEKTLNKLKGLSKEEQEQVERLVHSLVNKLLHKPTSNLKKFNHYEDRHLYLDSLTQLFELSSLDIDSGNRESRPKLKLLQSNQSSSH